MERKTCGNCAQLCSSFVSDIIIEKYSGIGEVKGGINVLKALTTSYKLFEPAVSNFENDLVLCSECSDLLTALYKAEREFSLLTCTEGLVHLLLQKGTNPRQGAVQMKQPKLSGCGNSTNFINSNNSKLKKCGGGDMEEDEESDVDYYADSGEPIRGTRRSTRIQPSESRNESRPRGSRKAAEAARESLAKINETDSDDKSDTVNRRKSRHGSGRRRESDAESDHQLEELDKETEEKVKVQNGGANSPLSVKLSPSPLAHTRGSSLPSPPAAPKRKPGPLCSKTQTKEGQNRSNPVLESKEDRDAERDVNNIATPMPPTSKKCSVCSKTFFDRSTALKHYKRVHLRDPKQLERDKNRYNGKTGRPMVKKCNQNESDDDEIRGNTLGTGLPTSNECTACHKAFFDRSSALTHYKRVHLRDPKQLDQDRRRYEKIKSGKSKKRRKVETDSSDDETNGSENSETEEGKGTGDPALDDHNCPVCMRMFFTKAALNKHFERIHGNKAVAGKYTIHRGTTEQQPTSALAQESAHLKLLNCDDSDVEDGIPLFVGHQMEDDEKSSTTDSD